MPIYTYECQSCNGTLEKRQSFNDDPLTTHDDCGGSLRRVIHPAGIVFKGSGFYNTDYKNGSSAKPAGDSDAKPAAEGASSEAKPAASTGDSAAASTPTSTPAAPAASTSTASPAASTATAS